MDLERETPSETPIDTPTQTPLQTVKSELRKQGRPLGSSNLGSMQPTVLAKVFKETGLDWKKAFAEAILKDDRYHIEMWMKLMSSMITQNPSFRRNGGLMHAAASTRPSKAALKALSKLEGRTDA